MADSRSETLPVYSPPLEIPPKVQQDWQSIVDLLAQLIGVPVGLIMRVVNPDIEVLVSSETEGNPYHPGDREHLWGSGLYCETVIKTEDPLRIPNALKDPAWKSNPDVKLGMIAYLGAPIRLPDGSPFGTLCVLAGEQTDFEKLHLGLLEKLRDLLESHLEQVIVSQALQGENLRLIDAIAEIRTLRGIIPICASCKHLRDDQGFWHRVEAYLQDHTEARLSHGLCPDCAKKLYPEFSSDEAADGGDRGSEDP